MDGYITRYNVYKKYRVKLFLNKFVFTKFFKYVIQIK